MLFVCLFFLVFSNSIYAKEDYENELNRLLKQVENCKDVSKVSKELNDLYIKIEEEYQKDIQKSKEKKTQFNQIHTQFNDLNLDYTNVSPSIPIYMKLYQMGKEEDMLDYYASLYHQKSILESQLKQIENEINLYQKRQNTDSSMMSEIQEAQNKLFKQFQSSEMKNEGEFNSNKSIQGNKDLPSYGGLYSKQKGFEACLMEGSAQLDSMSDHWIFPISNGTISAGTWNYPGGDLHLGLDVACSMYSPIQAPANGLVLYADAPVESNCGYLGNWCGWPLGGGNTICMICAVDGKLYGMNFVHLSQDICVFPGQQVKQGDVIARSGNSGNSTGPHCHIEIFELKCSLEQAVNYFIKGADFSFGAGYDAPATCSQYACRIRPESVWR